MAKLNDNEYNVNATSTGVRVLEGQVLAIDYKLGVVHFRCKQFNKTTRVAVAIPMSSLVFLRGAVGDKLAQVAYNSAAFDIADFVGVTNVKNAAFDGMQSGTTKKGDALLFNSAFVHLTTAAPKVEKEKPAKKSKAEKPGKVKKSGRPAKAEKSKGKKLAKAKW